MKSVVRLLAVAAVCLVAFAAPATAQYMYLDVNGDGVNTAADILTTSSTGVDIWLRTNVNGDGSPAVCDVSSSELTINSYEFMLRATGTLVYGDWTDAMSYPGSFGDFTAGTDTYHGRSGPQLPPGTYKLGRLALSGVTTNAMLTIVPSSPVNPPGYTSFGSLCEGKDLDNTYKLGSDWNDVGNTYTSGPVNQNPVITAPETVTVNENEAVTIVGSATDPDGDPVTLSQTNTAAFLTGPATAGPTANPSISLTGTPGFNEAGSYTIDWSAADNTAGMATATTTITVVNNNRPPVIDAPATVDGTVGSPVTITASAADPDGDSVTLSQTNNAPFLPPSSSDGPSGNPTITLTGTPTAAHVNTYTITWSANDLNGGTPTATTTVTISGTADQPVVLAPISDIMVAEGSTASAPVSATDADGDAITLAPVGFPAFATLNPPTTGNGTVSTTVTASPTTGAAAGSPYTVSVTATSGATTDTKTFQIIVTSAGDNPPVLAPIGAKTIAEGATANYPISATDPDGNAIEITATLPAFGTLNPPTTGTGSVTTSFTLSPGAGTAGTYTGVVTATANGLTDSETFDITVTGAVDTAPVLLAITDVTVAEGGTASTPVSASDADGDAITLSATLPSFATLNPPTTGTGAVSTSVTVSPLAGDAGTYPASVTATANGLTDTETFTITVTGGGADTAPVLAPIANITVAEGGTASTPVSATDADGDVITLSSSLPAFATLNPPTTGTGSVTTSVTASPLAGSAGTYTASVTATANGLTDTETFTITVTGGGANQNPTISTPATESVDEGQPLVFVVTAHDADNDPLTITATGVPSGATFQDNGNGTANFSWTPTFTQAGTYTVTFTVSDGQGGTNTATTVITVNNVNRCPTADAGGPYSGGVNASIAFSGTGSTDPDNDVLTYTWTFGDGGTATGSTVSHSYSTTGSFNVVLTVSDGICDDTDTATATVSGSGGIAAYVYTFGGNKVTNLGSGKPTTCVQIEPVNSSFELSNVDLSSIKMISFGTGSVSEITAVSALETKAEGDRNENGIDEIEACFSKEDLRLLFSEIPAGRDTVTVTIEGTLLTGGTFSSTLTHTVWAKDRPAAAKGPKVTLSPNPLNPETTLSFQISKPGRVTVKIYDLNGRLVKTLLDDSRESGYQDLTWNGTSDNGSKVSSGVYYFRLDTPDGRAVKTATVLK